MVKIGSRDLVEKLQLEVTSLRREIRRVNLSGVSLDSLREYAGGVLMAGTIVNEDPFLFDGETTRKPEFKWVDGFTVDALLKNSSQLQLKRL